MSQLISDIGEAWRRASYADYLGNGNGSQEIKNKLSTRSRLFIQ